VESGELLHAMADVAEAAGLEVRGVGRGAVTDGGPAAESGIVRLRSRVIVMLSPNDPLDRRIDVLAEALRTHADTWLEAHFIAPAIRSRLDDPPARA
jgi:hypothetical protein